MPEDTLSEASRARAPSERMRAYHRRKARSEARSGVSYVVIALAASAGLHAVWGVSNVASARGWTSLAFALGSAVLAFGIYHQRAWSRWPAVVFSVLACAGSLLAARDAAGPSLAFAIAHGLLWAGFALHFALPAGRELFGAPRDETAAG